MVVHLPHIVLLYLKQSLLVLFGVWFAAICHRLLFSALIFLGAVDSEWGQTIVAFLLVFSTM